MLLGSAVHVAFWLVALWGAGGSDMGRLCCLG